MAPGRCALAMEVCMNALIEWWVTFLGIRDEETTSSEVYGLPDPHG